MVKIKSSLESSERVCPVCGKTFILAPQHAYKLAFRGYTTYYCRYNCYRKEQKEREAKSGRK